MWVKARKVNRKKDTLREEVRNKNNIGDRYQRGSGHWGHKGTAGGKSRLGQGDEEKSEWRLKFFWNKISMKVS